MANKQHFRRSLRCMLPPAKPTRSAPASADGSGQRQKRKAGGWRGRGKAELRAGAPWSTLEHPGLAGQPMAPLHDGPHGQATARAHAVHDGRRLPAARRAMETRGASTPDADGAAPRGRGPTQLDDEPNESRPPLKAREGWRRPVKATRLDGPAVPRRAGQAATQPPTISRPPVAHSPSPSPRPPLCAP